MNREQERIRKYLEKNPVAECNKLQKKYYPMLFEKFAGVKDPRHQSYIEYTTKTMLGTLYYKCLGRIESMRKMTRKFNDEQIVENLYSFLGEKKGYEVNLPFTTDQAVPELLFPLLRVTLEQVRISQINGQKGI